MVSFNNTNDGMYFTNKRFNASIELSFRPISAKQERVVCRVSSQRLTGDIKIKSIRNRYYNEIQLITMPLKPSTANFLDILLKVQRYILMYLLTCSRLKNLA